MAQTYTSQWFSVDNGDTTTHNPQSLVPTDKQIRILNAEIQWEGVEETNTSTSYSTNTNSGSATATTQTIDDTASSTDDATDNTSATVTIPSPPSGYSFDRIEIDASAAYLGGGSQDVTLYWEDIDGTNRNETVSSGYSKTVLNDSSTNESYVGGTRTITFSSTPSGATTTVGIEVTTYGTDSSTATFPETTSVSYPSVPNGYSFDRHYYREEKNGSFVDSDFVYSNSVGDTRSVTSNNTSNTFTLEMETRGRDTNYNTEYTHDPSVSGDVSGDSGNITLTDNETSNWYSLSGLDPNTESFNHSIQDSGEARFRFRFDWEKTFPEAITQLRVYDEDTDQKRLVALADPSDSQLEYEAIRCYVDQAGQVLVLDVIADSSDPSAITSHRINHPAHGILYPRYYDSLNG